MKKVLAILLFVMMLTVLLAACGDKDIATPDSASPDQTAATEVKTAETTKVLETTAEGGTIEKDDEGNTVEKDKDGKIVAVTDKDGNPVTVYEYITIHHITVTGEPDNSGSDSSGASSSAGSGSSSKSDSNNNSNSGSGGSGASSGVTSADPGNHNDEEVIEEDDELPSVVVKVPEEGDKYELPIL